MSETHDKRPVEGLDFSRAQFDNVDAPDRSANSSQGVALACRSCSTPLTGQYYTANNAPLCSGCRDQLVGGLRANDGSTGLAVTWGLGGAVLGAGAYYLIAVLYAEIGLVALAVGIVVGKAVRRGAALSCHWRFRAIAVALTYLAIVSTYVPAIVEGMRAQGSPFEALLAAFSVAVLTPFYFVEIGNWFGLIILAIGMWEAYRYSGGPRLKLAGPFDAPSTQELPFPPK